MKLGIISDTHNLLRPEVLEALSDVDAILHAGDINCQGVRRCRMWTPSSMRETSTVRVFLTDFRRSRQPMPYEVMRIRSGRSVSRLFWILNWVGFTSI